MKKLFVSVPMKNRTEADIRRSIAKMHKIAEIVLGEELELIDSYIEDCPPKDSKQAVWYLGESLKKLSEADYFIGCDDPHFMYSGCMIEQSVAVAYDIYTILLPMYDVCPDLRPSTPNGMEGCAICK